MSLEVMNEHRARARGFAEAALAPSVVSRDRASVWDDNLFRRLGEAGLLGAALPRAHGGEGLDALGVCALQDGFGEGSGDAGLALAWAAHAFGCAMPILRFGDEAQRRRFLPKLARGEWIGAYAHEEPGAAGDRIGIRTRAEKTRGGWVLHGHKAWVVNGPVAHVHVVTAVTDPSRKANGISAFLVERGAPGHTVGERIETLGMRTATISTMTLDGCEVRDEDLLGAEGSGLSSVHHTIERALRVHAFAPWIGLLRALLEKSVARARERIVSGKPVAASQSIRAALCDMRIRNELCQRLLARAAALLDHGGEHESRDVAAASLFWGGAIAQSTQDALRFHGGRCGESDRLSERLYRDATLVGLLGGEKELLRAVVAGSLFEMG